MGKQPLFLLSVLITLLSGCTAEAVYPVLLTALPDPGPPYVYYYSQLYNAFVIERVDGTDSFVLGQGLMQNRRWWDIDYVAWSPSGHYLSWFNMGDPAGRVFIVGTDDQPVTLPVTAQAFRWSPAQDRVLYETSDEETQTRTVVVLDVPRSEVLLTYRLPEDVYPYYGCGYNATAAGWITDGSGIVYGQTVPVYNQDVNFKTTYWKVSLDGTVSALGEDPDLLILAQLDCTEERLDSSFISSQGVGGTEIVLSPDGRYVISAGLCNDIPNTGSIYQYYGQCIDDSVTGERAYIHHASINRDYRWGTADVIWHPTEPWVMIGDINRPAEGQCCKSWKIVSADGRMQREVMEGYDLLKWLPDRIDTSQFPQNSSSVIPMPVTRLQTLDTPGDVVARSPDGKYVASAGVNTAQQTEVLVWDLDNQQIAERYMLPLSALHDYEAYGHPPILCWSEKRLILAPNDQTSQRWDVRTGQPTDLDCSASLDMGRYQIDHNQLIDVSTRQVLLDTVGKTVLSANGDYLGAANCASGMCDIRMVHPGRRQIQRWTWPIYEHGSQFFDFTPDNQTLIGLAEYFMYDQV